MRGDGSRAPEAVNPGHTYPDSTTVTTIDDGGPEITGEEGRTATTTSIAE